MLACVTWRKYLTTADRVCVCVCVCATGTKCLNSTFSRQLGSWMSGNWSYSTAFYPGESRFSHVLAARVQQAMGLDPKNGGKFQITSYPTGKGQKHLLPHRQRSETPLTPLAKVRNTSYPTGKGQKHLLPHRQRSQIPIPPAKVTNTYPTGKSHKYLSHRQRSKTPIPPAKVKKYLSHRQRSKTPPTPPAKVRNTYYQIRNVS